MKILFVCSAYYPLQTAAANCVNGIIKTLTENNITCDVLSLTDSFDFPEKIYLEESTVYNQVDLFRLALGSDGFSKLTILEKAILFLNKIKEKFSKYPLKKAAISGIYKKLKKIAKDYDVIVPVVSDVNIGGAVMRYCTKTNTPYILYQVDPIATNQVFKKYEKAMYKFENSLYKNALGVVTTPILALEKENDKNYKDCNIIKAEFPNVRDLTTLKETKSKKIICSFCGYIYSGVRDASYTLKLFSALKDKSVSLKFAGSGQEDLIEEYSNGKLKDRLEHIGKISNEQSVAFMQTSDFLINIGNTMLNQIPSKIFDYISTGLPIINICKNEKCPTIPYLEKYGLALNLVETTNQKEFERQIKSLSEFVKNINGKRLAYSQIETLFKQNTINYVGNQFLDLIKKHKNY